MDPIIGLATIVGLLSDYVAEGRSREADAWDNFRLELDSKRHKRILDELDSNEKLCVTLKSMLENSHSDLSSTLNAIDNSLAKLLSATELAEVANAFLPETLLSDGALEILQAMEELEASYIEEHTGIGRLDDGKLYLVDDGEKGEITISGKNLRFLDDDLNTLLNFRLLRLDFSSEGNNIYHMTRDASNLVNNVKSR